MKEVSNVGALYTGRGAYSYTDIGLIGLISEIGLWSVLVYIFPVIRFYRITRKVRNEEYYIFLVGLFTYVLVTSISLIVTDIQRIFAWPILLFTFETAAYYLERRSQKHIKM